MIKCRSEMPNRKIEIDLSGPSGNAFYLLGLAESLGKQLNIPPEVIKDIRKTMTLGSYEDLIKTFDIWFGEFVILYK
tara:strand:- start:2476 stop:2706 length:231 start_codon:yes stop_codon:yes gene_type:complete